MMKKLIFAIVTLLMSFSLFAQTTLTLQKEITAQLLNSQHVSVSEGNQISVVTGHNQLAVTIGQIVFEDGKRRKFDSDLLVLTFDVANSQQLQLSYSTFRTIEEAKAFSSQPQLLLQDSQGNPLEFELVQLRKNGLQGFRDYQHEVAEYNSAFVNSQQPAPKQDRSTLDKDLQQSFLHMSREQQQGFMQWAMKNLK
ncbi:DUF2057 family protein [Vibrio sp. NH-UV-68]|uniref:YccT family protein n=1 Tax=unclassified Vibrio TaxID=2614977 RepID=UPI0036F26292